MAAAISAIGTVASVASSIAAPAAPTTSNYTHWSVYLLGVSAGLAIITCVALAILTQIPFAVICGVMGVTQIIGTYYLKVLGPQKALEATANQFSSIVKAEAQNQKTMQQTTAGIVSSTQQISQTVTQTSQVIAQGNASAQESERILKEFQDKEAANKIANDLIVSNLQAQLVAKETLLKQQSDQTAEMQKQKDELNSTVQKYIDIQDKISSDTKTITTALSNDADAEKAKKHKKELKTSAKLLRSQLKKATSKDQTAEYDQRLKQLQTISDHTDAVEAGINKIEAAGHNIATVQARMENTNKVSTELAETEDRFTKERAETAMKMAALLAGMNVVLQKVQNGALTPPRTPTSNQGALKHTPSSPKNGVVSTQQGTSLAPIINK